VSEVVAAASGTNATVEVVAHYDYAAFGAVLAQKGDCAEANPWRFSSEYAEDDTATIYYNYRHYESVMGRWMRRDPEDERGGLNLYYICNCVYQTDVLGKNRYITQFDILNYGGSGGTQLHVGVAVDRWICRNGQWKKRGITTFDFSIDWKAPWYNYILGAVWKARGRIVSSPGLNLVAPITFKSCPSQDVKMFSMIKDEMRNPPFYNGAFHNCLFWSVGAINYGMSEKCNDCCKE
jgi:RHS repeat-associated protein